MKKSVRVIILLCALSTATAWSQKVDIKGTISGLPEGTNIIIAEAVGGKLVPRDTIKIISSGNYNTTVRIDKPTLFVLNATVEKSTQVHVMAMPNDRTLEMNLRYEQQYNFFYIESSKGSRNMTVYQKFNSALYAALPEFARINAEYSQPGVTEQRRQELSHEGQTVQLAQKSSIKKALSEYSDCLMSAFLVTFFDNDFATYSDLYEQIATSLGKKYADDPFVENIVQKVASSTKEGTIAPEIAMKDKDGNVRKLSDLRGKVVLIDFWASWCGPCRAELPNVVRLYQKYHESGFEIYSVSLDKDRNAWLQSIQSTGQVWPNHVSDLQGWTSSGGKAYGVSSIPHTVLIDRKGRIIAKKLRGGELASKLQEIFGF